MDVDPAFTHQRAHEQTHYLGAAVIGGQAEQRDTVSAQMQRYPLDEGRETVEEEGIAASDGTCIG